MLTHVPLNMLPYVQRLTAAKGSDVVPPFQKNTVLESLADGAAVVFDARRQLVCCEIGNFFN